MARLNPPIDEVTLSIVPWYIIGHAAYAKAMMERFPEDHPIYHKHKLHYEALERLSEGLSLPSEKATYHARDGADKKNR